MDYSTWGLSWGTPTLGNYRNCEAWVLVRDRADASTPAQASNTEVSILPVET